MVWKNEVKISLRQIDLRPFVLMSNVFFAVLLLSTFSFFPLFTKIRDAINTTLMSQHNNVTKYDAPKGRDFSLFPTLPTFFKTLFTKPTPPPPPPTTTMSQELSLCTKEEFLGQFPTVIDVVLKDLEKEDMVGLTPHPHLPQKGVVCLLLFFFFLNFSLIFFFLSFSFFPLFSLFLLSLFFHIFND